MVSIIPCFERFPKEGALIGRLLAGYTELEFLFALCVGQINNNSDATFKAMYRVRGENSRLMVGDGLVRAPMAAGPYRSMFERAVADLKYCMAIRNQYAHAIFLDVGHGSTAELRLADLEEIADESHVIDLTRLTQHHISLALLQEQEAYFLYVKGCVDYLNFEAQFQAGRIATNWRSVPQALQRPLRPTDVPPSSYPAAVLNLKPPAK